MPRPGVVGGVIWPFSNSRGLLEDGSVEGAHVGFLDHEVGGAGVYLDGGGGGYGAAVHMGGYDGVVGLSDGGYLLGFGYAAALSDV